MTHPATVSTGAHPSAYIEDERHSAVRAERRRLAQELHDSVLQSLNAALLRLELALAGVPAAGEAAAHLTTARHLLTDGMAEARRCLDGLWPRELADGLDAALATLTDPSRCPPGMGVTFQTLGQRRSLPPAATAALLRIGQEAVSNACRHAHARLVRLVLVFDTAEVRLTIEDDGHGFDPAAASPGYGLEGMRARAEELGGRLTVMSGAGRGTAVCAAIPASQGASAGRLG